MPPEAPAVAILTDPEGPVLGRDRELPVPALVPVAILTDPEGPVLGHWNRAIYRLRGAGPLPVAKFCPFSPYSWLGVGGMLRVYWGFLDHEGASGVYLPWGAEVLDVVEGARREVVHADAVVVVVDSAR